jgi:transglutaminase-like putative cysteine protease
VHDAEYLRPTTFIDCDHADVIGFAREVARGRATPVEQAVALFEAVRDGFRYDPYRIDLRPEAMRASSIVAKGYGFCIPKSVLLAAAARVLGIPSRLGFADVKNHLTTEKLSRLMETDLFVFHGYAELLLQGKWLKATTAFNSSLCERFDVEPLQFDGRHDALLQQRDRRGNRYMEYVRDRGSFADLPLDDIIAAFETHYPILMSQSATQPGGSFEEDAATERPTAP